MVAFDRAATVFCDAIADAFDVDPCPIGNDFRVHGNGAAGFGFGTSGSDAFAIHTRFIFGVVCDLEFNPLIFGLVFQDRWFCGCAGCLGNTTVLGIGFPGISESRSSPSRLTTASKLRDEWSRLSSMSS